MRYPGCRKGAVRCGVVVCKLGFLFIRFSSRAVPRHEAWLVESMCERGCGRGCGCVCCRFGKMVYIYIYISYIRIGHTGARAGNLMAEIHHHHHHDDGYGCDGEYEYR